MLEPIQNTIYELKEHGVITHPGFENDWNIDWFRQNFSIKIVNLSEDNTSLEFDLINADCSFVNAIRRILMVEVPSIAIERVYLHQNTTVMPDEVFCHRLGLIPLAIDQKHLNFPSKKLPQTDDTSAFDPNEHVLFDINASFTKSDVKNAHVKQPKDTSSDVNFNQCRSLPLYSSDLQWVPLEGQKETFGDDSPPAPVSSTILLNKLALGDEIMARCVAVKGIGRDHAKFSPVSVSYYKFLPVIKLLRTVEGEQALKLQKSFAPGVIELDPLTQEARVANPRLDNGSREHMRHPEFRDDVIFVGIDPKHCIFTVESISPVSSPPPRLIRLAIDVMISKCLHYIAVTNTPGFGDPVEDSEHVEGLSSDAKEHQDPTKSASTDRSARAELNGREVELEVTHISQDRKRGTFTFSGEDHTLGLALRFCVLRNPNATFCGYCVPHPLEDMIHFDVQVKKTTAIQVLRDGLQCLHDCFVHMKATFKTAMSQFKKSRPECKMDIG